MVTPDAGWTVGETVVLRGILNGTLWYAGPAIVVEDSPSLIALYWQAGTIGKLPKQRPTAHDLMASKQFELVDTAWQATDILVLALPGAAHSVYAMWDAGHTRFRCWYINLQAPLRRSSVGFDTMDYLLDVVVAPDRQTWQWKDEDEFAQAQSLGRFSASEAAAIRAEAQRAVALLQAEQSPYRPSWQTWRPPATWERPQLSAEWDRL